MKESKLSADKFKPGNREYRAAFDFIRYQRKKYLAPKKVPKGGELANQQLGHQDQQEKA